MSRVSLSPAIAAAIAAALLFGASTPIVKQLLHDAPPILLAGLLYLGSGIGLGLLRTVRDRGWRAPSMTAKEWLWLLLAIGFGGVLGPVALLLGLTRTSAASASLLLDRFPRKCRPPHCSGDGAHCRGRGGVGHTRRCA
jgi:drug/metabolite transporter (DMT)-like permease